MKQEATRKASAFTRIELTAVVVVVVVLATMFLPALVRQKSAYARTTCLNNLKEIGTAYRLWAGDGGDKPPAGSKVEYGGWADFLTNADPGAICWTNYAIMQDQLSRSPKLVVCPSDERRAAADFTNDFKDNTHLSYFVGVNANDVHPESIQGGDRNLGAGTVPDSDYGFSPKSGKGNDVTIPITGPVSWSLKMHSAGKSAGVGNILLGDGRSEQTTSASFRTSFLSHDDSINNWPVGHVPAAPSIRLVFP